MPGKIGDIIISLPIAKYYYDKGYEVHWPIYNHLISHFTQGHINYVKFIPVPFTSSIPVSRQISKDVGGEILDMSFTSHGCWDNENSKKFLGQKEKSFDVFRYFLADVSIEEKWKLSIERNLDREKQLFNHLVKQDEYVVYQFIGSDQRRSIPLDNKDNLQLIEIKPYTDCVFDWITVLEKAKYLVLIDSCFSNLVEQLNMENKKYFIQRNEFIKTPKLKNEWKYIEL